MKRYTFFIQILTFLCFLSSGIVYGQSQVLAFKFSNEDNGKQASNTSTSTHVNLEISTLSRGLGASGKHAASGSGRSMVASLPVSTTKAMAISSSSYFEFFVKSKSGYYISLTELNVTLRRQTESAYMYRWKYSMDGGNTFKELGTTDLSVMENENEGVQQPSINLSGYSDLKNVPSSTTIIFRIYAWGGVQSNKTTTAFGIGKSSSAGSNAISIKGFLSNIEIPGKVLAHVRGSNRIYPGSPSICILPNGNYIASCDFFGPNREARVEGKSVTRIYQSEDAGESWTVLTDIVGQFMSNLFIHQNNLYILGLAGNEGNIIIRKSTDGGTNWTIPTDSLNGVLMRGRFHTAPTPVVQHNGRLWRAMEDVEGPMQTWPKKFRAFMLSASENADLLKADTWISSNALAYDSSYLGGYFYGWLEGNAVVAPGGNMLNLLRVHTFDKLRERIALINVNKSGTTATFNQATGFTDFPGGGKKFTIRFDSISNKYWTLSNYVPEAYRGVIPLDRVRNTLALCSSIDLLKWKVESRVLYHPDTLKHGFQYVDWQFAGEDIIAVSRTAYDDGLGGANSHHNNNFFTFHRIKKFRSINVVK